MKEFLHRDTETHLFRYLGRNQYTFKTSKIVFTITKRLMSPLDIYIVNKQGFCYLGSQVRIRSPMMI